MPLTLENVLIRSAGAATPHAYDGLAAERELGLAGSWEDPDGDGNYCIVG
jgi:hypothetical protein